MASKGLGPLPRRRGSALAHGRGALPLLRAAAVSTVHEALCMKDFGVAAARVPESLSSRTSNWRIKFGTTESAPASRASALLTGKLQQVAPGSVEQHHKHRSDRSRFYLSSPALSRLVEELFRRDFLSVSMEL